MDTQAVFVLKIFLYSTGLSFLIKYGGQLVTIEPTTILVLTIVLFPSLIIGLVLGQNYQQ